MAARPSGRGAFSRPPILGIPESVVRWSMRGAGDWDRQRAQRALQQQKPRPALAGRG
jgi:hypothetical protein